MRFESAIHTVSYWKVLPLPHKVEVKMPLYITRAKETYGSGSQDVSYLYHFNHAVKSSLSTQTILGQSILNLTRIPFYNCGLIDVQFVSLLLSAEARRQLNNHHTMATLTNRPYHENHMRSALALVRELGDVQSIPLGLTNFLAGRACYGQR